MFFKLSVILCQAILIAAGFEGGFRLYESLRMKFLLKKNNSSPMTIESGLQGLNYEWKPGNYAINGRVYNINSHGFRWREFPTNKPFDVFRTVIVGDSIPSRPILENAFPFKLENIIKQDKDIEQNGGCEIIDASVEANDMRREYYQLKHKLLKLKPDMIILAVSPNDSVFIEKFNQDSVLRDQYKTRHLAFLYNKSLLWRKMYDRLSTLKSSIKDKVARKSTGIIDNDLFDRYQIYFNKFITMSKENGIKLTPVIFPTKKQMKNGRESSQPRIYNFAHELGVNAIDMIETLKKYNIDAIYEEDGIHFTDKGHTIIAKELYGYIKPLLPPAGHSL